MKIAMITSSLAKRGQTRIVYELVEEYIKNGIDITVYYFDEKKGFLFSCETKIISFFQTINFDNYDIVHTHGIRPDAYVYFHNKNIKKAKTVTTLHSYIKKSLKNRYNTIISLIFSYLWNISTIRHDAVVVLSQDAKKYYSVFWKNKNLYVIYNGISKYISVSNNIPNKKNHIHIGAVGLITTIKGFEQLIKVLVEDKNIFLSLVGDGKEEESLRELATNLGVENQVDFLGFQKDVGKYLKDMDIYIIPSRSEGFPVSLLEAASIKKAVVCSNIPIFKEIFSEKEVVFFELDNIKSLYSAILKAYEKKLDFEKNIYNRFINEYSSSIMAKSYLSMYRKIIKNG